MYRGLTTLIVASGCFSRPAMPIAGDGGSVDGIASDDGARGDAGMPCTLTDDYADMTVMPECGAWATQDTANHAVTLTRGAARLVVFTDGTLATAASCTTSVPVDTTASVVLHVPVPPSRPSSTLRLELFDGVDAAGLVLAGTSGGGSSYAIELPGGTTTGAVPYSATDKAYWRLRRVNESQIAVQYAATDLDWIDTGGVVSLPGDPSTLRARFVVDFAETASTQVVVDDFQACP